MKKLVTIGTSTSKRAISNRGYLTDLGLVPLANPQEAITQVK